MNFCGDICDNGFLGIEDAKFCWEVSASYRKSRLRMHNFNEKHPHVLVNWTPCQGHNVFF